MPRQKQERFIKPRKPDFATSPSPSVLEPLLKMPDMVRILPLSKPKIYELIAQGLPSLKIDGARRFQPSAVKIWIDQQAASWHEKGCWSRCTRPDQQHCNDENRKSHSPAYDNTPERGIKSRMAKQ